jgi:type IV fimbrial biogenesis protein FimT
MVVNYSMITGKMILIMPISRGFTLIELLVTLSVASILLSMAVPSYRVFIQDSLLLTQSNSFFSAMMLAKSEAIKRGSPATICPSIDGAACTGGTVWSNGWLVFADPNSNGVVDAGEQILQVSAPFTGGNTLNGNNRERVTFSASGFAFGFNGTFSLCDDRGAAMSRAIILNNQGRLRTETGAGACS